VIFWGKMCIVSSTKLEEDKGEVAMIIFTPLSSWIYFRIWPIWN